MSVQIQRRSGSDALAAEAGLPGLLTHLLRARGVTDEQDLAYPLTNLLAPQALAGMETAVDLLLQALSTSKKILVVGDFDVDGATSTALALSALREFGHAEVDFLVPNRFITGYGLTPEIVDMAAQRGAQLIITVDNGISSIAGVAAANQAGIDVLVTDHHLPGEELPAAAAIINPNCGHCDFPSKALAGVGVIFYLMAALRGRLRDEGWFAERGLAEPNMAQYLDLVALGTVADVVPLDYNNRIFVHHGIQRIRAGRCRPGIIELLRVGRRNPRNLVAADLGFAVAPRLNAAGRLDDMSHGILCLLGDDEEARRLAVELDGLNSERRDIEQTMQQEAVAHLEGLDLAEQELPFGLCLYDAGWHQGVVGILASRIREKFHRPVIAFADAGGGMIKGSARSVPGLHIRDALDAVAAAHPGLLNKFGGHAMAAGMELPQENFPMFAEAFDEVVRVYLSPADLSGKIDSDGTLPPPLLSMETAAGLRDAGPWGQHFPEPVFDGEFLLRKQKLVGTNHLKLTVAEVSAPMREIDAIWFNVDTREWPNNAVDRVRLVYRLDVNEFRGFSNLQLMVQHMAPLRTST